MPAIPSITISLVDLDNLIQFLAEQQYHGGSVTLVDYGLEIIIRDPNGMLVGTLGKTEHS